MVIKNMLAEPDFRPLRTFTLRPGDVFVNECNVIAIITQNEDKFIMIDSKTGHPLQVIGDAPSNVLDWRRVTGELCIYSK